MRHLSAFIAPLALCALAACSDGSGDLSAEGAAAGSTIPQEAGDEASGTSTPMQLAETGWLTVGKDGAVQTTFFDPDGRYRDLRNGEEVAGGRWERRADGRVCFEPDVGLGACWETGDEDATGSIIATDTDGTSIALRRVTYIAPPAPDADAAESEGAGS